MRRRGDITWHGLTRMVADCAYCNVAAGRFTLGNLNLIVRHNRGRRAGGWL